MDVQTLLDNGYRPYQDTMAQQNLQDWYRATYQRRVTDEHGTRYFINIHHGVAPPRNGEPERPFFEPHNQFQRTGTTFNIMMLHHNETLTEVEAFFAELWTTMKLDYYERNN